MGSYLSSTPKIQSNLAGRVVIVTGANRGLGLHTVKQLYELGATVYLGCRTEEKATETIEVIRAQVTSSEGQLKWFPVDLSTIKKARESAEEFLKLESSLNILINNAGVSDKMFEVNEDGIETMMAINHFGTFVFTMTLLDLLRQTSVKAGSDVRIVTLSSMAHDMWGNPPVSFTEVSELGAPFPPGDYDAWSNRLARYGRSRLGNILFISELQRRLDAEGSNIIAMSLHPGTVATDSSIGLVNNMPIFGPLVAMFARLTFLAEPEGARSIVFAAADPAVRAEPEKYKGKYLLPVGKVSQPSKPAQDVELSKHLWELTEKVVETKIAV